MSQRTFNPLNIWPKLQREHEYIVACKAAVSDRNFVLDRFLHFTHNQDLPIYFWNSAYDMLQQVKPCDYRRKVDLHESDIVLPSFEAEGVISSVVALARPGIFVLEGLLKDVGDRLVHEIENAHFALRQNGIEQYVVLLDSYLKIPLDLYPLLPALEYPMPSRDAVQGIVADFCWDVLGMEQSEESINAQRQLVQACSGLPRGEIDIALHRAAERSTLDKVDISDITGLVMGYKTKKLKGRGINMLPEPDVPVAAGMDRLYTTLDKVRLLLQPEAEQRNLRPPKAILLWGIPGTGKSLAAKLAAKHIGGTLVSTDWNGLVGRTVQESMNNLNGLLDFVDEIGTCILFFDEFEKAFSGWDTSVEGGVLGKLAGRLLSWMQDHTSPVVMFATINHLQMLPAEMIRRFEYVHFFGMPHAGSLWEVFKVHLKKYFEYDFSDRDWRVLLREYRGCTPAEVAKAVQHVADAYYFRDMQSGNFSPAKPHLALSDLIEERQNFSPASTQRDISDQIAAIQNRADYAIPVSGPDTSPFAVPDQSLMGIDEDAIRTSKEIQADHRLRSVQLGDSDRPEF
ncbi:MAG: AAA family ATPase [Leptolyngbya sp. SIO4C5]|nr:AAA family ATPase [Leptolyngbya sp. SIO4C5]